MSAPRLSAPLPRLEAAPRWRPAPLTAGAPHVRDALHVTAVQRWWLLAALPVALAGAHATGRSVLAALQALGREAPDGWRGSLLAALRLPADPGHALAALVLGLAWLLPVVLAGWLVALAASQVFARFRRRPASGGAVLVALLVALWVPPTLPPWQAAVAVALGVVLAGEVFGGTGMNLLHPALAALAFLAFTYPGSLRGDEVWVPVEGFTATTPLARAAADGVAALSGEAPFVGPPAAASTLAVLLGAALLLARRLVSWRVLAGGVLGVAGAALLAGALAGDGRPLSGLSGGQHLALGGLPCGLLFFGADPVTGAVTDTGRWLHGLLAGALVVLLRTTTASPDDAVLLGLLLAAVVAPLVDHAVIARHVRRRRLRHG